jgi:hypothetical protein
VPPGLLPRFCVGNSQGNLYVLAGYTLWGRARTQ